MLRYIYKDSLLHKSDARLKLLAFIAYVLLVFLIPSWTALGVEFMLLLVFCAFAKLNIFDLLKSVAGIAVAFAIVSALNIFVIQEGNVVATFWVFAISSAGISRAAFYACRLILGLLAGALLLACTPQMKLCEAISQLLSPLQKIGVPISQLAFILSLALRFVPDVYDEFQTVRIAQKLRGAKRNVLSLFIPVTVACIRRSEALSFALLSKNYVPGAQRTSWSWEECKKRKKFSL